MKKIKLFISVITIIVFFLLMTQFSSTTEIFCELEMINNPGFEDGYNPCWWWGFVLLEDDFENGNFNNWTDGGIPRGWDLSTSQYKSPNHAAHVTSNIEMFYEDFENGLGSLGWVVEAGGSGTEAYYEGNPWQRPLPPSPIHWCYLQVDSGYNSAIYVNTGIAVEEGKTYTLEYYTGSNPTGWDTCTLTAELWAGDPTDGNSILLGSQTAYRPDSTEKAFNSHEFLSSKGSSGNLFIRFVTSKTDEHFEQPILDDVRLELSSYLISDNLDTSQSDAIRISFWYKDANIDDNDDVRLQLYNGLSYDDIILTYPRLTKVFELGNTTPEDKWHLCRVNLYNEGDQAQYFHSNFRIRFQSSGIDPGENLWIDDVVIEASADITDADAHTGNYSVILDEDAEYCKYKGAYSWIPGKTHKISVWAKALGMSEGSVDFILDNEVKGSIDSDTADWEELTFQYVPLPLFYEDFENGLGSLGWVVDGGGSGTEAYYEGNPWQRPLPPSPIHWCYLQADSSYNSVIYVDTGIAVEDEKTYTLEYYTGSNPTGWDTCILTAELWAGNPTDPGSIKLGTAKAIRPATRETSFNSHEFMSNINNRGNLFIKFETSKTAGNFEQPIIDNVKITSFGESIGNLMARYNNYGGTVYLDDWSICEIYEEPNILINNYHGLYYDLNGGILVNPERGFRYEMIYWDSTDPNTDWSNMEPNDLSLTLIYVVLNNFNDKDISQPKLDQIKAILSNMRNYGIKCILRFAYRFGENPPIDEPDLNQIITHIDQLESILIDNKDVIYAIQIGFLGHWGEWHTIDDHLETWEIKAKIVEHILNICRSINRKCMIRRPYYKLKILEEFNNWCNDGNVAPADFDFLCLNWCKEVGICNGHSDTPCCLIGFHNDGFLANQSDGGTFIDEPYYANPGNKEFDYMTRESPYVPIDGELFVSDPQYWDCNLPGLDAAVRMRLQHYTSFGVNHSWDCAIANWQKEYINSEELLKLRMPFSEDYFKNADGARVVRTLYDYIHDHLGYRIELKWAAFPKRMCIDDTLYAEVNLINFGFSAFVNPRPVYFLLIGENDTTYEFEVIETDPRSWHPFKPGVVGVQSDQDFLPLLHKVSIKTVLPQEIGIGIYKLGLWLPDESLNLRNNPKYAVRVANCDVAWYNGINILGQLIISICDECPDDPNKTEPGACGCGKPDIDIDGDGTMDCFESSLTDPNKTDSDLCFCGVADADSDGEGPMN